MLKDDEKVTADHVVKQFPLTMESSWPGVFLLLIVAVVVTIDIVVIVAVVKVKAVISF